MKRKNAVRLINGTVAALLVAGGFLIGQSCGKTPEGENKVTPTETVMVRSGDTLWSIASERCDGDVRPCIALIKKINDLDSSDIYPGQQLTVPIYE